MKDSICSRFPHTFLNFIKFYWNGNWLVNNFDSQIWGPLFHRCNIFNRSICHSPRVAAIHFYYSCMQPRVVKCKVHTIMLHRTSRHTVASFSFAKVQVMCLFSVFQIHTSRLTLLLVLPLSYH